MVLTTKASLIALLTIEASSAFAPAKGRIGKLSSKSISNTGRFMSGEEEGDWIKSVNSKEIFFDEKTGRFFETKKLYDEGDKSDEVSGPFKGNPLAKPQGTFFDDLFSKKEEKVSAPAPPAPPAPPAASDSGPQLTLDSIFGKKEEPVSTSPPAPVEDEPQLTLDSIFGKEEEPAAVVATPSKVAVKSEERSPFDFFSGIFKGKDEAAASEAEPEPIYYDPVTISNDFRVAGAFLAAGLLLDQIPYIQVTLGPLVTLLGLLFLVQSFRIRFVFNENNELELVNVKNFLTGEVESSGENVVVGGENVWACDTIVNYDFFPPIGSSPVGPVLVYFKETQTEEKFWNDGPGEFANKEEKIRSGEAVPGQVHFFPAVCSSEQIRDEFEKRNCGKL